MRPPLHRPSTASRPWKGTYAAVVMPQPAGKDERAERRGDPPVQRHEGGETGVHIENPGFIIGGLFVGTAQDTIPLPSCYERRPGALDKPTTMPMDDGLPSRSVGGAVNWRSAPE
jgi:hypothetical protein